MRRYQKQRRLHNKLRFSEMGKASQRVQAARRMESFPERLRYLQEVEIDNLPKNQGDLRGVFQWIDIATGKVTKWRIRIGDRANRVTVDDSRKSQGMADAMVGIRKQILGNYA